MKKKYLLLVVFSVLLCSFSSVAQVLNQSAGWPNTGWTVTGTYSSATGAFEADPTVTANFAFDEDDAGSSSDDSIAAESPIIDLTPASTAGEYWITASVNYVYRNIGPEEVLEFQYYDADVASWQSWENTDIPGNDTSTTDNFCTGSKTVYTTTPLNITNFTITQLSGFKYRIFYDDDPAGPNWAWGFCFDSPTIVSAVPPCLDPTSLVASNITQTSADLGWTENGTATTWNVEYGPTGFAQGSGTLISTTTNPYSIASGLTSGTNYDFYVQSDCGGGDLSAWTGPETFNTQYNCSTVNLSISSTTGATIPCIGSGTLTATASGIGNDIYWYNAATGGTLVGIGPTYTTPQLTATTSYWATEVITTGTPSSGYGRVTGSGDFDNPHEDYGLVFDVDQQFTLVSVDIYSESPVSETATIELRDSNDVVLQTATATFPPGNGSSSGPSAPTTVQLNFLIPPADDYRLVLNNVATTGDFLANTSGNSFPYALGLTGLAGEIKSGITSFGSTPSTYYTFYNWSITTGSVVCESPRVQATATISTAGDITVAPTAANPLPYSNTNDSANYGDPYSGVPGSGCATTNAYLNGNNVVYHFTPDTTEMVNILMSNLSGYYAGVFVYGSCADIGTTCLAGAVAGPSDADFGIMDFPVTAGEDYYIVVTSWLTSTVGYTLDIVPFDCATLEDPDGASPQDFVLGDTPSDLDVDPTRTGATLNWYSDAAGTIPIDPTTEPLVDGVTYYVTQTFNGCESAPPMGILVDQIDCSTLAITATTDDMVSCKGALTLTATSSGTGDDIYWYNVATGGNVIETGPTFTTPVLTTTTSYWVSEVFTTGTTFSDQGRLTGAGDFDNPHEEFGLVFDAAQQITLISVNVYNESPNSETADVELRDANDVVLQSKTVTFPPGNGSSGGPSAPTTVMLNFTVPVGTGYRLVMNNVATSGDFLANTSGNTFPYPLGPGGTAGQITSGISSSGFTSNSYYTFYNWTISTGSAICESTPRTQVIATVNQSGDVVVDYTQVAPTYTTTDNTSTYGNDFSGDPGTGCDGAGILDGDDVVYQYTADPTNDNILDIELSAISNPNTGMYIYASCGDIGTACIAGGTNENGLTINIDDYYVTAGTTFFIVISSESSSTNYTLTINGIDCANVAAPTIADPTPYFGSNQMLDDLTVDQNQYSTGLTWYSALPPSAANEIDPATTPIVDGTTYYVTQTILGCESAPLAITPEEFQCGNMKITSATSDFYLCAPGGAVTLDAQGTGTGNGIYWYDAPTGGNIIATGSSISVNVSQTTSFWVTEVFSQGGTSTLNPNYCIPNFSSGCSGFGDDIDDFILTAPSGTDLISHLGTGCSTNNYGDYTADPALIATLAPGSTYTFSTTHNESSHFVKIWIDFDHNGSFADAGELLFTSSSGGNSNSGSITIPSSVLGGATVMRVMTNWLNPATDSCTPSGSFGETHDYKVILGAIGGFSCESARTEITVTVNDQPTAAPTGNAAQKFCEGQTLADVVLTGSNIQWYDSATGGSQVSSSTVLTDGAVYYASQTVNACESDARTEITVYVDPIAAAPAGNINQSFYDGEFISDLDVVGDNLTWYEEDGTPIADPTTFPLENYETYCVAQTPADACESELLCITVHELLGADDPLFEGLSYYPNPVRHKLFITNTAEIEKVELYDLMGRKVLQKEFNGTKGALDVSGLQSGTYLLWVTIDGKTGAFKLIKE